MSTTGMANFHIRPTKTDNSEWFEGMYSGRSRDDEIASSYLREERDFIAKLVQYMGITGPSLEVGCGVGMFAALVPDYIGLEYSLEALRASGFDGFNRVCGSATALPFPDRSFQFILSVNTLEHVLDVDAAIDEIDRVCQVGGVVVLRPAWHCAKYITELVNILPYADLSFRNRLVKLFLPFIKSRAFKFAQRVPWRIWRRMTAGTAPEFRWRKLRPYHGPMWQADADAVASIDIHETIMYFVRRGYTCMSHKGFWPSILAGHEFAVLRKN